MATESEPLPPWLRLVASEHAREHHDDCLGTVGYIDAAARLRGVGSVSTGLCYSLGAVVRPGPVIRAGDERSAFALEWYVEDSEHGLAVGSDRVESDVHGSLNTHLDGLTHVGLEGTWHGGEPCSSEALGSLIPWAAHGIVTRGVLVDIPALRQSPWAEEGQPVTGDEIDAALDRAGIRFQPGDALLAYMGRDAYIAAGQPIRSINEDPGRPGLGPSAAWIADNRVSLLCWDFLDAGGSDILKLSVHRLIWAIGLAIVDNCELGQLARATRETGNAVGMLAVAPVPIPGATGCFVNPLVVV